MWNKNIITKDTTNFYNEEGTIIYTLPESYELPIIVNKKDIYGVEFNDRLLYVKTEDVKESIKKTNTKEREIENLVQARDALISLGAQPGDREIDEINGLINSKNGSRGR